MANTINFIREKVKGLKLREKRLFIIKSISLVLIAGWIIAVITIISHNLIIKKENQVLQTKINNQEAVISNLRPLETQHTYLVAKAETLTSLLAKKNQYHQLVSSFLALLPEDILLTEINIDEQGTVNFSGRCADFQETTDLLTTIKEKAQSPLVLAKQVKVNKLNYNYQTGYLFDISVSFFTNDQRKTQAK